MPDSARTEVRSPCLLAGGPGVGDRHPAGADARRPGLRHRGVLFIGDWRRQRRFEGQNDERRQQQHHVGQTADRAAEAALLVRSLARLRRSATASRLGKAAALALDGHLAALPGESVGRSAITSRAVSNLIHFQFFTSILPLLL